MDREKEDRIISEFLQSIGPWRDFVIIGGGYALIIYRLYLADQAIKAFPVGTKDIDSLIPRTIPKVSEKNIAKYLSESNFTQHFKGLEIPATEIYVKKIDGVDLEVEFLTDNSTRKGKNKNVIIRGVVAQPLRYLNLSFEEAVPFITHSKVNGYVVSPGAWIFHKGLTFTRRKSDSKAFKDLYGIWYVTTQLGTFSDQAITALRNMGTKNPKWLKTFQNNLSRWLKNATPLDWSKVEAQDPSGELRKASFKQTLKRLVL